MSSSRAAVARWPDFILHRGPKPLPAAPTLRYAALNFRMIDEL